MRARASLVFEAGRGNLDSFLARALRYATDRGEGPTLVNLVFMQSPQGTQKLFSPREFDALDRRLPVWFGNKANKAPSGVQRRGPEKEYSTLTCGYRLDLVIPPA
ncbi:unnamed protein product [Symbiodinium natans]|uniref:Uncharacterized protein n=1 Tax=Symbiodinium natans TaxID=878477 RepID=A0A812N8B8_9DINO|nr:unnamed protein product [Symbiodinium natans]